MRGCWKTHAREIVGKLPSRCQVAELGSGSGKKTRWILEALSRRQKTYYFPIEISPSALAACEKELGQIDLVSVVGHEQPYLEGLRSVAGSGAESGTICWCCFWEAPSAISIATRGRHFCGRCARILRPGDALLLGTDLEKSVETQNARL